MHDHSISVPACALSTAATAANRLYNHVALCSDALVHHAEGAADLSHITETLAETAVELRQLHALLGQYSTDSPQMLLVLENQNSGAGGGGS